VSETLRVAATETAILLIITVAAICWYLELRNR